MKTEQRGIYYYHYYYWRYCRADKVLPWNIQRFIW